MRPARRSLALALAALALLAAGAAAVPAVRDAVGDLLGLDGATVERVPRLPASPGGIDLGRPVTARRPAASSWASGLRVPHDARLGAPDGVYLRGRGPVAQRRSRPAGLPAHRPRALPDPVPRGPEPRPDRQVHRPGHRHEARARATARPGSGSRGRTRSAIATPRADPHRGAAPVREHPALDERGRAAAPRVGPTPATGARDRAQRAVTAGAAGGPRSSILRASSDPISAHEATTGVKKLRSSDGADTPSGAPWPRNTSTGTRPSRTTDQCRISAPQTTVANRMTR